MPRVRFTIQRSMIGIAGICVCLAILRSNAIFGLITTGFLTWVFFQNPSEERIFDIILKWLIGYCAVCTITIPFMNSLWLGEIPLLALVQLPKITFADWLRVEVVMKAITKLGRSRGSFSPDYTLARPYALAIAYLLPLIVLTSILWLRTKMVRPYALLVLLLGIACIIDYVFTLIFADTRSLTIY